MTSISGPGPGGGPKLGLAKRLDALVDLNETSQPQSTFGGKAAEPDSYERSRVPSPLRTRSRAVTSVRPEAFQKALDKGFDTAVRNRLEGLLSKLGGVEAESTRPAVDNILTGLSLALESGLEQAGLPTKQSQALASSVMPAMQTAAVQALPEGFKNLLVAIDQGPVATLHHAAAALGQSVPETAGQIAADPIGFAHRLLESVEKGFRQFASNVAEHFVGGAVGWTADTLDQAGVDLPQQFDLKSMNEVALEILGLTAERALDLADRKVPGASQAADLLFDGLRDAPDIARELLSRVVEHTAELASRLSPLGAVLEAVEATYRVSSFFVDQLSEVLGLVDGFVGATADVARGEIAAAADHVEASLQETLPVAIGFLSELAGLGSLSSKVKGMIGTVQEPVDKAVDWGISRGAEGARLAAGFLLGQAGGMLENARSGPAGNLGGYLDGLKEVGVGLARLAEHGAADLVQTGLGRLQEGLQAGGDALDTVRAELARLALEPPSTPTSAPPGSAEIVADHLEQAAGRLEGVMEARNDGVDAVMKMVNAMFETQQRVMRAGRQR